MLRAVGLHKTLASYVSATLLPRLITKKIWTQPLLWEGFIRCAKTVAPSSFTALSQLPRDQLKEVLDKLPGLKPGLWQYLLAKSGTARAQTYAEVSAYDQC